jgi:molecular chaperone GrpE
MADTKKNEQKGKESKEILSLKDALKKAEDSASDLKKTTQFVQAEFENYKKRQERDFSEKVRLASYDIITKLLPVIDDFEHSLANLENSCVTDPNNKDHNENVAKGLQMVFDNFFGVLKKEGLQEIDPLGEKFDPYLHEAVMQEKSDKEPMTIIQVLQKGYKLHDRIIRHARVKVSQK